MHARALPLLAALAILAGCKDLEPIPAEDLGIEVHAPFEPVTPARAFELRLVRRWNKRLGDLASDGTWERAFPPLVVRLARTERREDAEHIEETRTYLAYAMSRAYVVVQPVTWKPKAAPDLAASTPRLTLRVRPEVDADDPGPPEIPAALEAPRRRSPWLWALVLALLSAGAVLALRRGRRGVAPPTAPAPPELPDTTRSALEALAGRAPNEIVLGAAEVVRHALARRLAFPAGRRTREETLAAAQPHPAVAAPLTRLLTLADAVAYGRHAPTPSEAQHALGDARTTLDALPSHEGRT